MRLSLALLLLFVGVGSVSAQERIPDELALRIAKLLADTSGKLNDLQVKVSVDVTKPFGLASNERGGLLLPDSNLTSKALAAVGKEPIPVGQLWLKGIVPLQAGKAVPNDKLRLLDIKVEDETHKVTLLLLAAQKNDKGDLELLVFGKEKAPLAKFPLQKSTAKGTHPLEMNVKKLTDESAEVEILCVEAFQATLTLGKSE